MNVLEFKPKTNKKRTKNEQKRTKNEQNERILNSRAGKRTKKSANSIQNNKKEYSGMSLPFVLGLLSLDVMLIDHLDTLLTDSPTQLRYSLWPSSIAVVITSGQS